MIVSNRPRTTPDVAMRQCGPIAKRKMDQIGIAQFSQLFGDECKLFIGELDMLIDTLAGSPIPRGHFLVLLSFCEG